MTKLSFQLYSARDFTPYADVFKRLSDAGYMEVEGFGGIYSDLDEAGLINLRDTLDQYGLSMATGHFAVDMIERDPDAVLKVAKTLGMHSVYAPYLAPEERPSSAKGWLEFGKKLQKIGQRIRDAGYDFGWHNHDFEFLKLEDGSLPIERIFEGGPDLSWEADIAWVVRGGADPFVWIEKYNNRITAVHVKDIAPEGEAVDEGGWADVGYGTVPWKKLVPLLRESNARHFIVEHDNPKDIDRLITRSVESFKTF